MQLGPVAVCLVVFGVGAAVSMAVAALIRFTFWAVHARPEPSSPPGEQGAANSIQPQP